MSSFCADNQNTIFGEKLITTIGYNEQEMIRDILYLHGDGNYIDCDPTYSVGNFYKAGLPQPKYKFDKYPERPDVIEATSDNLPLESECCNIIMFDPPFVIGGQTYEDSAAGSCIISKRFCQFTSWDELKSMYWLSLVEFYRILRWGGTVIFKCQDTICSSTQYFSHCYIMDKAIEAGFYAKDLFILLAKSRLSDGRKQQHGRKYHSYYWVFKKLKTAQKQIAETNFTCKQQLKECHQSSVEGSVLAASV